ncbi:hypothetical protein BV898_17229 [Hypsibius exemplaris]|uniref:GB1/RHD3-type G domain-containing protein n=1 Tax=Hypsibius exemplaris TaxID=2072580 RepID=A0A9X6NEZ5_HYPEX|nr:hypothetical protein BV898_17229 [Hypsibius exemplaris]
MSHCKYFHHVYLNIWISFLVGLFVQHGRCAPEGLLSQRLGRYPRSSEACWCPDRRTVTSTYQIAKLTSGGHLQFLNFQRFLNSLTSPDVRSREVAIIGIVGAARSGKSTILNILHRYLTCKTNSDFRANYADMNPASWLYEYPTVNAQCSRLFPTSPHQDLCTKGVWITAQPYLTTSNKAIFLLDTQGLFTNQINGSAVDSGLFYTASLLSSTLIVNVVNHLDTQLSNLFAALMLRIRSVVGTTTELADKVPASTKLFQQLLFLIRNYQFQNQTGEEYLENYAKKNPDSALNELERSFERVEASLLPSIASNPGNIIFLPGQLNQAFEKSCSALFYDNFSPQNVQPKTVFGARMNGAELSARFHQFHMLLKKGQVPTVEDVYQKVQLVIAQEEAAKAFQIYETKMLAALHVLGPGPSEQQINELDVKIRKMLREHRAAKIQYLNSAIEREFTRVFQAKVRPFMVVQLEKARTDREKIHYEDYNRKIESRMVSPKVPADDEYISEDEVWRTLFKFKAVKALVGVAVTLIALYFIYSMFICFCRARVTVPAATV